MSQRGVKILLHEDPKGRGVFFEVLATKTGIIDAVGVTGIEDLNSVQPDLSVHNDKQAEELIRQELAGLLNEEAVEDTVLFMKEMADIFQIPFVGYWVSAYREDEDIEYWDDD